MSYNINSKIAAAKAEYEEAVASFEAVCAVYNEGAKPELTIALNQQKSLQAKIDECHATATTAQAQFQQAFEAAGYEHTNPVRQALNRKNDALAMGEELQAALAKVQIRVQELLLDASPQASAILKEYAFTREKYGQWQAYEAMGEPSQQLKKAVALAWQTIPPKEISAGRPATYEADFKDELAKRVGFIWDGIKAMAMQMDENFKLPFAAADISPLTKADLLTPVQRKQLENSLKAMDH